MKTVRYAHVIVVGFVLWMVLGGWSPPPFLYFPHSSDITTDTWYSGSTHYITTNIAVLDDNTLTIQPGVTVKFAPGATLSVYGTLNAIGTSGTGNDILFTSRDDTTRGEIINGSDSTTAPGDWNGIYVYGGGTYDGVAAFDYVTIRYGGNPAGTPKANLYYYDDASGSFAHSVSDSSAKYGIYVAYCDLGTVTIDNSTIRNSADDGIYSSPLSNLIITNNTFTGNTGRAAYVYVGYQVTMSGNTGSGNGTNALDMEALSLQTNCSWATTDSIPIVLSGQSVVAESDTLTVAAGSIVKGRPSGELWVSGTLLVNGTAGSMVTFTSLRDDAYGGNTDGDNGTPYAGDWDGIYLYGSGSPQGIGHFNYARITYGGADGGGVDANITFNNSDTGSVSNSYIGNSGAFGIYMSNCSHGTIPLNYVTIENSTLIGLRSDGLSKHIITNCGFNYNLGHAGYLQGGVVTQFSSNAGTGNGTNGIGLDGTLDQDCFWSSPGTFPVVLFAEVTVAEGKTLTIGAGSVIKARADARLFVDGTVDVNGTADSMVTFTSNLDDSLGGDTDGDNGPPAPGDWKGIVLYGVDAYEGTGYFDYTRVRYGHAPEWGGVYANVEFYKSDAGHFSNSISEYAGDAGISIGYCSPTITASIIRNNSTYGIHAGGGTLAAPVVTNNTINNNGNYAVYLDGVVATSYAGNTGSGNATNEFGVYGDVTGSVSWGSGSNTLPVSLIYPVTVASGQTLTFASGVLRCNTYSITGDGSFSLSSGATLQIGSMSGLNGNVNVSGTKTFNAGANFSFYAPGGGAQVSSLGFPATVNDLTIHNPSGVTLSGDVAVNGTLTLTEGDFNLNGKTTSFGAITGTNGTATIVKSLNAPTAENVGGLGAVITTGQNLGSTTVKIGCSPYTVGGSSIKRWYAITPTNNSDLNATLEFPYLEGDQLNGIAEANLTMFRSTDAGTSWTGVGGLVNTAANTVVLTGIGSFSQWTLGDINNPLPVELSQFAAQVAGTHVVLKWTTASEVNSAYFEVERMQVAGSESSAWFTVASVRAAGTSEVARDYSWTDETTSNGRYAYRLKQVDASGAFKYSASVEAAVLALPTKTGLLQNYPNPFNPTTAISYQLSAISQIKLGVYDLLGREVAVLVNEEKGPGSYVVEWSGAGQQSGVYFVRLTTNSSSVTKKVVLQK